MDNSHRKALHEACKYTLLKAVQESKSLRKKLSFQEHVDLCNHVLNMSYEKSVETLFEFGVRDFESRFSAYVKYGAAAILGGLAGGKLKIGKSLGLSVGLLFMYFFRKTTDPCWQACFRRNPDQKQVCKYMCYIKGCDSVISDINKQINRCDETKNPIRCERGLNKALVKWKKRKAKYRESLDNAKESYAELEATRRAKKLAKERRFIDKLKGKK